MLSGAVLGFAVGMKRLVGVDLLNKIYDKLVKGKLTEKQSIGEKWKEKKLWLVFGYFLMVIMLGILKVSGESLFPGISKMIFDALNVFLTVYSNWISYAFMLMEGSIVGILIIMTASFIYAIVDVFSFPVWLKYMIKIAMFAFILGAVSAYAPVINSAGEIIKFGILSIQFIVGMCLGVILGLIYELVASHVIYDMINSVLEVMICRVKT